MDYVLEPLPAVIFGLKHHEHRIVTLIAFLSSTKASFYKRSKKATLSAMLLHKREHYSHLTNESKFQVGLDVPRALLPYPR
jgi:hypothetical protein